MPTESIEDFIARLNYSASCDVRVHTVRIFHKWTNDKWKERWRAGWMAFMHYRTDKYADTFLEHQYDTILHGAN